VKTLSVAIGAVVLAASVSACTSSPGAAALVGDSRISTATLQKAVDAALADPQAQQQLGQDRPKFIRNQLGQLIDNMLIGRLAASEGITVSNADIDQQMAALAQQYGGQQQLEQRAAAGGVPANTLRTFVRYFVLQQKIAEKLASGVTVSQADLEAEYQKNIDTYDQVDSQHILVKTKKLADSLLAQVRHKPSSFASLAARYSIDTGSKAKGGNLGFQAKSTLVKPFADAIFAAKPGTYLEVHSQFGWHVVHVIAHRTTPLSEVAEELKQSILAPRRDALLKLALTAESRKVGVHVNPRSGRWDAANGAVVAPPANKDVSSPAPASSG
jgi:parvulin-like peptidyl-prolyl isomerase